MPLSIILNVLLALLIIAVIIFIRRAFALKALKENSSLRQLLRHVGSFDTNTGALPAAYFLYLLGSGGHTAEMCELIKATFSGQPNVHRRYVVTSGDSSSVSAMQKLENKIQAAFPSDPRSGTFDCLPIPRARHVHQPFYTAPFTTVQSAMHIVRVLTRRPDSRPHCMFGDDFRYPHVIVTNGPGTGFVVCVVAYMLKLFMITPQDRLKVVYVESWARSQTLSLTGKLFHLTGLADLFLVQQQSLARKFDKQYIGVFNDFAPSRS